MGIQPQDPFVLKARGGLSAVVQRNGTLTWLSLGDLRVNLYPGTALEAGPANLWLRIRSADAVEPYALLGPASGSAVGQGDDASLHVSGTVAGLRYLATLRLAAAAPAWSWQVVVTNATASEVEVDVVAALDVGLAHAAVVRTNELYVSQYLDFTPFEHPERGWVLAVRQNQPQAGRHPWLLLGSLRRAVGFCTDALQLHGLEARAGRAAAALSRPSLPSTRLQHEHSLAVVQDEPVRLAPGGRLVTGFFGHVRPDHPEPTTSADLAVVDEAVRVASAAPPAVADRSVEDTVAVPSLFDPPVLLATRDLTDDEVTARYGDDLACVERRDDVLLSFFAAPGRHVATRAKELRVLRPHGHLLRTGSHLLPEPESLTTTTAMTGLVNSFLTRGHVATNRLLSTARGYLGRPGAVGQRVFVEQDDRWRLLDVPSAYEMEPDRTRWVYRHGQGEIEVTTHASAGAHEITLSVRVTEGEPARFLVVHHVGWDGDDGLEPQHLDVTAADDELVLTPPPDSDVGRRHPGGTFVIRLLDGMQGATVGGDGVLFADGASRGLPYLTLTTRPTTAWRLRISGTRRPPNTHGPSPAGSFWADIVGGVRLSPPAGAGSEGQRLQHLLPWLAHNALVHYLSPRGIEQYTGGAWGTRDVSQGPVELLLALGRDDALRGLLPLIFRAQSPAGDWPQAFGFLDDDQDFRSEPSHGDVVLWPLLALGRYLTATGDGSVLDEQVPYYSGGPVEPTSLLEHAQRALRLAGERTVAGTRLTAYGHGDWNDSLQPADPTMPEHMCSAWTVTLHYQALRALAAGLTAVGRAAAAAALQEAADAVLADFRRLLLVDGVLAGYAHFGDAGSIRYLIHPTDRETGLTYSLLPMIHAISNEMLTPDEAARAASIIRRHLLAPDGARLFDRPPTYRGGSMVHFRRAETATFFGREIGLMYTHAHLRHAEAMAHLGDGEALLLALQQANPIGIEQVVPNARPRQSNCYYSSSDACFADRYDADRSYDRVRVGEIEVEGGWRVYSSGAGIMYRLVLECLLGLRRGPSRLVVDPVLPPGLDGLRASVSLAGQPLDVVYRVGGQGGGPEAVLLDGRELAIRRLPNRYRAGGLEVAMDDLRAGPRPRSNELTVIIP